MSSIQIQQSPWNTRESQSQEKNGVRGGRRRFVSPLWTERRKTARCKDSRCSSWPRPGPWAAASAPSRPPSTGSSGGAETVGSEGQTTGSSPPPSLPASSRHLDRHDLVAGLVHHLVDGAVRSSADLSQILQILGCEVPVLLRGDLQLPGRLDAVSPEPLSDGNSTTSNVCLPVDRYDFTWTRETDPGESRTII